MPRKEDWKIAKYYVEEVVDGETIYKRVKFKNYKVSSLGKVINTARNGSVLKGTKDKDGNDKVGLTYYTEDPETKQLKKHKKIVPVKRLVAFNFMGLKPQETVYQVKNKWDNGVHNLKIGDHAEAVLYSYKKKNNKETVLNEKLVRNIRKQASKGVKAVDIANSLDLEVHNVYHVLSGKAWNWVQEKK